MKTEQSKGQLIMELFSSIRLLFRDISLVISKFDEYFSAKGYTVKGGSSITKDNSTALYDPDRWLLEGIYRLYTKEKDVIYGFNISFRNGSIEPIVIAGKIKYLSNVIVSEWDLWDSWYTSEETMNLGEEYTLEHPDKRFISCTMFAIPLVDLTGNEKIQDIGKKIMAL